MVRIPYNIGIDIGGILSMIKKILIVGLLAVAMLIMFIQPGLNIFTRVIGIVIMGFGIIVMLTSDVSETR